MKGMGNLNKLMKQAQQMQDEMAKVQESLADAEVEGAAGGGAVKVRMNGRQEVLGISIQPEMVDPENVDMLEDTILAAIRDAHRLSTELAQEAMGKVTGGMGGLPGMF